MTEQTPNEGKEIKNELKFKAPPPATPAKQPSTAVNMPKKEEKEKKSKLLLILLLLFALGSGGLGWLLFDQTKKTEVAVETSNRLEEEKAKVEADLQKKIDELTELTAKYGEADSDRAKLKADLEAALADLKKYKATASRVYKAQAAAKDAENRYNMLKMKYDSLSTAHMQLTADFNTSQTQLTEANNQNSQLTQKNDQLTQTVHTGQALVAYNVQANGIQVKKSGKERVRDKAGKANKIEACFMLGKNAIAETGTKSLYLRIETPDGVVLASGTESNQFTAGGKQMMYTSMKELNYTGDAEDICMSFKLPDGSEFKAGQYQVEIYCEENKIGESTLNLE
ncbi:MAG: hypothetical protein H6585_00070 [Flavobacteriales bacterium]|nr:hypothetical protein [Flavobacteriales bacterium]MCB9446719.1 hypothetical protein [Flavobacteriales bacterium]